MLQLSEKDIVELEDQLRTAMIQSNILVLEKLLADGLVFTNHLGQVFTKVDDIDAHSSGVLSISSITPTEERIQLMPGVAIVTVKTQINGTYKGSTSEADFRFTRVWVPSTLNVWQVLVAHSSIVCS